MINNIKKEIVNKMKNYKNKPFSFLVMLCCVASAVISVGVVAFIIIYVLIRGIPHLTPEMFSLEYTPENCSMLPSIINTVIMTVLSLLIALPIAVFSAIYIVEYQKRGSKFAKVVALTTETLSGIPSIIYGLFGYMLFVGQMGLGYSLISGVLTMSIMIFPLIMRTSEEALTAVPDSYREGSFGLGAGKLRTVFKIILPSALPGIMSGVILAVGRIVGESAALIFTSGSVREIPDSIFDSAATMTVHMYNLYREGLYTDQAFACAAVLLVIVLAINALSRAVAKKIEKK